MKIHEQILAALLAGETRAEVTERLGVLRSRVDRIAQRHVEEFPQLRGKIMGRGPRAGDVPAWAKAAGLSEDYRDITHDRDEFAAASHCRRLLAEAKKGSGL